MMNKPLELNEELSKLMEQMSVEDAVKWIRYKKRNPLLEDETSTNLLRRFIPNPANVIIYKTTPCPNQDFVINGSSYFVIRNKRKYELGKLVSHTGTTLSVKLLLRGKVLSTDNDVLTSKIGDLVYKYKITESYSIDEFTPVLDELLGYVRRESTVKELMEV